mgnify:CR=1 FL=1
MSEILNYDDVVEKLNEDGIMQEPDANWIIEYIGAEYGGHMDIYWCTQDERPYVSQDGYYYEDYQAWSERAVEHMIQGGNIWIEPHIWDDMEHDFTLELEQWWSDVYDDLHQDKIDELVDDGYEYEE